MLCGTQSLPLKNSETSVGGGQLQVTAEGCKGDSHQLQVKESFPEEEAFQLDLEGGVGFGEQRGKRHSHMGFGLYKGMMSTLKGLERLK